MLTFEFDIGLIKNKPFNDPKRSINTIRHSLILAHCFVKEVQHEKTKRSDIANRFRLSPTRVSQICNLCFLSPSIQEDVIKNNPPIAAWRVRDIIKEPVWEKQNDMWKALKKTMQLP